jgi:hypothetical protein
MKLNGNVTDVAADSIGRDLPVADLATADMGKVASISLLLGLAGESALFEFRI